MTRPPLHRPERPLHHFLHDAADRYPERIGLRCQEQAFTFRELDGCVNAFSRALVGLGIAPGDRVAVISANRPEWVMAELGVMQAGAAVVMPNPSWKTSELAHALDLTRPHAVVADAASAAMLDEVRLAGPRIMFDEDARGAWLPFWELVHGSSGQRLPSVLDDWSGHEAALPFSSGTTGLPKAVRHTHASLVANTVAWKSAALIDDTDWLVFFFPLCHVYGIVTVACSLAAAAPLSLFPRFDLDAVLASVEADRSTIAFAAAPIAVAMAEHPDLERYDLTSLRFLVWGATPMVAELAERVTARTGVPWIQGYGASEAPILHATPVKEPGRWRLDTPGLPVSDMSVRIVDLDTRHDLPAGEIGEVLVRGPNVMAGYLPAEADADAFEDGWLRTGDVGWVEPEGWIHLTDRAKEMLKVNAFQVAPAELEQVLFSHGAVADCAVYGVPDPRTGEAPKAAVVVRDGASVTADELLDWVAARVAAYKRLRAVVFVDAVPRTPSGKALRRVLREVDPASR